MRLTYQNGFANEFGTEALEGALPEGRNSPQRCGYGLYAEQFSGTAVTSRRAGDECRAIANEHSVASRQLGAGLDLGPQ